MPIIGRLFGIMALIAFAEALYKCYIGANIDTIFLYFALSYALDAKYEIICIKEKI